MTDRYDSSLSNQLGLLREKCNGNFRMISMPFSAYWCYRAASLSDTRCEGFTETSTTKWCPEAESNHRHEDFQSSALPTELSGLDVKNSCDIPFTG